MIRSWRSVRAIPLTGLGGAGGIRSGLRSMWTPTQPEIEKKNRSTSPQNSPSILIATSCEPSDCLNSRASRTRSPWALIETTTRLSSPLTKMPPLSMRGAVPNPTSTFADASSLIGPALHLISKPAPKPTANPSKLNRSSPPRCERPPCSIIRNVHACMSSVPGSSLSVTGWPYRL